MINGYFNFNGEREQRSPDSYRRSRYVGVPLPLTWRWAYKHRIGMGGLASALALAKKGFERIEVYETASNLGFVGAGIQLAPNMARILDRLGCWADIEKEAVDLKETSIRGTHQCLTVFKEAMPEQKQNRGRLR